MSNTWSFERVAGIGGYHRIVATGAGLQPVDITFVRDTPVGLPSYSTTDPFSDATAQLLFPMLTDMEDLDSPELNWLAEDTLIDIWWVPALEIASMPGWDVTASPDTAAWINPITDQLDITCPAWIYNYDGTEWTRTQRPRGYKVWEGFIASLDVAGDGSQSSITASCQGALFQADLALAKPFYPPYPQSMESLMAGCFNHVIDPALRTRPFQVQFPAGWGIVGPAYTGAQNIYAPNVGPGVKWTGYATRMTGSWDHKLTSFIQNLLSVMVTQPGCNNTVGNQWTLRNAVETDPLFPGGRTPVLSIRDRYGAATWSMWAATPGLEKQLTRDATQKANVLYGTGTDIAGTTWRNAVIAADGSRTDYAPLAWDRAAYPPVGNPARVNGEFLRETYVQFGTGFAQNDAAVSAALILQRDVNPGWSGTITLKVDPAPGYSRWRMRAGETFVLQGYMGSGPVGIRFHVAQVEANPQSGTVTLTVDTRYRDLLTVNEAIARNRDALTPAKLLQVNRNTVTIEDIQAPWDYSAGSGYVPKASVAWYAHKPTSTLFPYSNWAAAAPPRKYPGYYVLCNANNSNSQKRWAKTAVLMSEKGTIRRSEFFLCDENGQLILTRFHVSLYYNSGIDATFMPNDGKTWSPFIPGAFQSIDPSTGEPWAVPGREPDGSIIMGWGTALQPAGYSPGLYTAGTRPTGRLVDESGWTFDCSVNNPDYDHLARAGKEAASVITVYAMLYAEWRTPVFFGGRLFRQEPGTDT